MMADASRNPTMNFGKRRQISAAPVCVSMPVFSQRVVAIIDSTRAQIPIHTSRPITFIKVKALTAASALPLMPATWLA